MWSALFTNLVAAAWAKKAAVAAAVLLALVAANRCGYHRGRERAHAEDEAASQAALAKAEQTYRAREDEHAKQEVKARIEFVKTEVAEEVHDSVRTDDLRSGRDRVRIRVARCSSSPAAAPAASARVDGTSAERPQGAAGSTTATAELDGATAAKLYAIAADADRTARRLEALQDWARRAVQLCNGAAP
jgi:hypothetical protein